MKFCNIYFNLRNKSDLFERIDENKTKFIITVGAEFIVEANTSSRFFNILNNYYTTFDGRTSHLTARILNHLRRVYNRKNTETFNFEKLSGSDIVYDFCDFAREKNYKIFFLGAKPENNNAAVNNVRTEYNITVGGYSPEFENYPYSDQFNKLCLEKIASFRPHILFVGFGAPKQEYWIDDNIAYLSEIGVQYAIGCGGTIDFVSQKIKRAPVFIQKLGLEGVFRIYQEPNKTRIKRLIRSFKFFKYIWHKPDFTVPPTK